MIKDAKHIYLARCHKICSDNDNFSLLGTTFIVYLYTCHIYLLTFQLFSILTYTEAFVEALLVCAPWLDKLISPMLEHLDRAEHRM